MFLQQASKSKKLRWSIYQFLRSLRFEAKVGSKKLYLSFIILLEYQFAPTLLHLQPILVTVPFSTYLSVKRTRQELFDFVVVQQEHYYLVNGVILY